MDVRTALIEHFRDDATIMLATEAAAEGINLQFCSLVINYDLPWNPQRIEQRIGRCHRYGQKHDVVVINFLNERNEADRRVLELLGEKFSLFNGVFGASDEVLGTIESGVDFEKRILAIYQECRTPEEIDDRFPQAAGGNGREIRTRMDDTRRTLFEHFDEDVHQRLRLQLDDAKAQLDRVGQALLVVDAIHARRPRPLRRCRARVRPRPPAARRHPDRPLPPDLQVAAARPTKTVATNAAGSSTACRIRWASMSWTARRRSRTPPAQIVFDVSNHPTRLRMRRSAARQERLPHAHAPGGRFLRARGIPALFRLRRRRRLARPGDDGEALRLCRSSWTAENALPNADAAAPDGRSGASRQGHRQPFARAEQRPLQPGAREAGEVGRRHGALGRESARRIRRSRSRRCGAQARQAVTLEEQHEIQEKIQKLERQQRRQRQEIFKAEDEIMEKRDALIESLEKRLAQRTDTEALFTIRWAVDRRPTEHDNEDEAR